MATILVIEKQPHLRLLLEQEFADADYACIGVESSDDATEVMMFEAVDVIVVGVGWPPQDDLHTLCWLKKFYPEVPIVLFAGEEDLRPQAIARLADAWVEKCSRVELLIAEVGHMCMKFPMAALSS